MWRARVRGLVESLPDVAELVEPLLIVSFARSLAYCTAACWPSSETMMCAGV